MPTDPDRIANYVRKPRTSTTGRPQIPRQGQTSTSTSRAYTPRAPVDTTPGTWGGYYRWTNSAGGVQPQSVEGLQAGYNEYSNIIANGGVPGGGLSLGGSGGGGGGRGGGGGGGGGAALTQSMIDAMARALGANPQQLTLQQTNLPAFRGTNMAAFNPAIWQQALGQINTAVTADQANIAANSQQLQNTLQNNYTNPYASAQVTPGATATPQGAGLMGTVGGTASAQPAQQANAANQDSQAAFQNLLSVLGAADQSAQNSRMAQVPMDANYATQGLNAQALGMRGQVGMAQTQAQQQWAQADAERRYQNSLMQQQWNRENLQNRQNVANTQATTNYQTGVASQNARLQPILDLIMRSAGTTGLNFNSLYAALGIKP